MTWTGAPKIIDTKKAILLGPWYVAEARIRNMTKWFGAIVSFGVGNPILLLMSVGLGVGALVDANSGPNAVDGVGYMTFLAPALLAGAAIQNAMDETSFPTLEGFLWEKTFFAMNSTQLSALSIVNGIMIASTIRTTITVFIFEAVLIAFGAISWAAVLPLAVAAIMVGAAFAAAMLATAARVINDDGFFAIVGRFIIAPMMLFSGTYYPLSVLPLPLQAIGWVSPLWHATQLGRVLSYGLAVPAWLVAIHVIYLVALGATGIWLAKIAFEKRLG